MLVVLKRYKPFFFGAISEWLKIFFLKFKYESKLQQLLLIWRVGDCFVFTRADTWSYGLKCAVFSFKIVYFHKKH